MLTLVFVHRRSQPKSAIAKRKTWEDGIYKSSTSALADCLVIHQTVLDGTGADMELIKALLKNRGFKFKSRTPILTNIVKLVFGDCGRRTEIYSYALELANKRNVASNMFAQWVKDNGGVESISVLKNASTKSEKLSRVDLIKIGQTSVEQLPALAELPDLKQLRLWRHQRHPHIPTL